MQFLSTIKFFLYTSAILLSLLGCQNNAAQQDYMQPASALYPINNNLIYTLPNIRIINPPTKFVATTDYLLKIEIVLPIGQNTHCDSARYYLSDQSTLQPLDAEVWLDPVQGSCFQNDLGDVVLVYDANYLHTLVLGKNCIFSFSELVSAKQIYIVKSCFTLTLEPDENQDTQFQRKNPLSDYQWYLGPIPQTADNQKPPSTPPQSAHINLWNSHEFSLGAATQIAVMGKAPEHHEDLFFTTQKSAAQTLGQKPAQQNCVETNNNSQIAGLIAAIKDNEKGGFGIAPASNLTFYEVAQCNNNNVLLDKLAALGDNSIYGNAFPISDIYLLTEDWFSPDSSSEQSFLKNNFEQTLQENPKLQRSVYVFSLSEMDTKATLQDCYLTQQYFLPCMNSNANVFATHPRLMQINAINKSGKLSSFSSAGSNTLLTAPGGGLDKIYDQPNSNGLFTTDNSGCEKGLSNQYDPPRQPFDYLWEINEQQPIEPHPKNPDCNYTVSFHGNKAAAAIVSAVAALLKSIKQDTNLVQSILVKNAKKIDPDHIGSFVHYDQISTGQLPQPSNQPTPYKIDDGWQKNAAGFWFSNRYGFGLIDAYQAINAMIACITNCVNLSIVTKPIKQKQLQTTPFPYLKEKSADDQPIGVFVEGSAFTQPIRKVQAVQLTLTFYHPEPQEVLISVTSPAGTTSILKPPFNFHLPSGAEETTVNALSYAFWGEDGAGEWAIHLYDLRQGNRGKLSTAKLLLSGEL